MRGDEERLRRLALILLDNAIKYTPGSEESRGRVILSVERIEGQAVLRVQNTGIGIDPADMPHLCERFYRADRAREQGWGYPSLRSWLSNSADISPSKVHPAKAAPSAPGFHWPEHQACFFLLSGI